MSVRSFKIFSGVLLAHLLVLSVIWVGFSAPFPRPPAIFVYEGALPAEGNAFGREGGAGPLTSDQFAIDHPEGSSFNHWTSLRGLSKSSTYDHLGF